MHLVLEFFSNLSSVYYRAIRRADCEETLLWSFANGYKLLYIRLHIFIQSEESIKLITVQFKNWLFLAYNSLFKHIKDILYFLDSLIFSVSFYKRLQCVSQQSFLLSVTMSWFVSEMLFMRTEIYIFILCMCIFVFEVEIPFISSAFDVRSFFLSVDS